MPVTFRAATFNVENLFSRAKVLNMQDHVQADAILRKIADLKRLLGKATYSAADKKAILDLYKSLSAYIEIREDRGKLFTGKGANQRVTASGAGAWDGVIEFKRAEISEMARVSTAAVVKALNAHILCTVEVENRLILQDFNSQSLASKKFNYAMLIDGNDERGIDVGLLTRFEIMNMRSHVYDRDAKGIIFSRDCLEVELRLPDGRKLAFLCNHLKSQGYGPQAANDAKRLRQTTKLAEILGRYNLATDLVIVAGDMNDNPSSPALHPLTTIPNLFDVLALKFPNVADRLTSKSAEQARSNRFPSRFQAAPGRTAGSRHRAARFVRRAEHHAVLLRHVSHYRSFGPRLGLGGVHGLGSARCAAIHRKAEDADGLAHGA